MVEQPLVSPGLVILSKPALLERQNYGVYNSIFSTGSKSDHFGDLCRGVHRSDRSSWEREEEKVQLAVGQLSSGVGSEPASQIQAPLLHNVQTWTCPRNVSVLSQTQWAGLGSATGSPQDLLIPSPRKSFIKDMRSQRRPSVTCSWAASRTRRQASDMPCRFVFPDSAFLPLLSPPPPLCAPVSGANDDPLCIS